MRILSHRGYWRCSAEKNSLTAFERSRDLGFGTETDVRDLNGRLVIAHDMPTDGALGVETFLSIYREKDLPLAINVKADGLIRPLKSLMESFAIGDWFVFDMSIPDTRSCLDAGAPVFVRASEVEQEPAWIGEAAGVWLDSFSGEFAMLDRVEAFLERNLHVCVVSPELHGCAHKRVWERLKSWSDQQGLMLCTDYPEQARAYFEGDS